MFGISFRIRADTNLCVCLGTYVHGPMFALQHVCRGKYVCTDMSTTNRCSLVDVNSFNFLPIKVTREEYCNLHIMKL